MLEKKHAAGKPAKEIAKELNVRPHELFGAQSDRSTSLNIASCESASKSWRCSARLGGRLRTARQGCNRRAASSPQMESPASRMCFQADGWGETSRWENSSISCDRLHRRMSIIGETGKHMLIARFSAYDPGCVKTHTSAKCKKYNSPTPYRAVGAQYDLVS